jgi:hypothetical protein
MMSEQFDPYHVWLAIAPEDQPPTLYRLLGLRTFEDNPDVIENAADQRMAHLRTFQSGKRSAESQKLLNEVSSAKLTLLNAKKKAEYDEKLRVQMRQKAEGKEDEELSSTLAGFLQQVDLTEHKPTVKAKAVAAPATDGNRKLVIGTAVGVGTLLVLLLIAWGLMSGGGPAKKPPRAAGTPESQRPGVLPARPQPTTSRHPKPARTADKRPGDTPAPLTITEGRRAEPQPARIAPTPDATLADVPAAGPTVDLLKLIDPKRDAVQGEAAMENGVLVLPQQAKDVRVRIRHAVPEEYVLTAVAERKAGNDSLNLGLVVGDHQTMLSLDASASTMSQLWRIDGLKEHGDGYGRGRIFGAGERVTVVCAVRKKGIYVTADGKMLFDFRGGRGRLSLDPAWEVGDRTSLFVGVHGSCFHVHKLTLTPVGEPGRPPKGAPPESPPPPAEVVSRPEPATPTETRLPVPPAAEQQKKLQEVDEAYEFSKHRTPEERVKLATELCALAKEFRGEPAGKFVLLRKAVESAQSGGDAKLMLQIVDAMGAEFQIDLLAAKEKVLAEFVSGAPDADQIQAFVGAADPVIEQALGEGRCDIAVNIAEAAYGLSQQNAGKDFRKRTYDRRNEVRKLAGAWKKIEDARAALQTDPDDADANLTLGRWLCFERSDWARGLPHLAKCADAALQTLARQETTSPPATADAQLALADAWWDLAEKAAGKEKDALMFHSGQWYAEADAELPEGLAKIKVQKRLADIAKLDHPAAAVNSRETPIRVKPLAHWKLDDGKGDVATDSSGNGLHGKLKGFRDPTLGWVAGAAPLRVALNFDGVDDHVKVEGDDTWNRIDGELTITAWVSRNADAGGPRCIVSRQIGTSNGDHFWLGLLGGQLRGGITTNEANAIAGDDAAIPQQTWTHVAMTYDGAALRLYRDGKEVASQPAKGNIADDKNPITIGGNENSPSDAAQNNFSGRIAKVWIYSRALPGAEIARVMARDR